MALCLIPCSCATRARDHAIVRAVLEYETLNRVTHGPPPTEHFLRQQWYAFQASDVQPSARILALLDSVGFDWHHPPPNPYSETPQAYKVRSVTENDSQTVEVSIGQEAP